MVLSQVLARVLARGLAALSAAAFLSVIAVGCGAGLSKVDADARCDQEKAGLQAFFDDKVYASCEGCYMQCGDDCVRHATSPITYVCPSGGAGGSSTTASSSTGP